MAGANPNSGHAISVAREELLVSSSVDDEVALYLPRRYWEDEEQHEGAAASTHGGSRAGRGQNKDGDFCSGVENIQRDYVRHNPVYSQRDFERRF